MIYQTYVPRPPLSDFVDWFWYFDGHFPEHARENVLPHGALEWIIDLRSSPKRLFDKDDFSKTQSFKQSWIAGAQSEYIVIEAARNSSMMGVHFKPGGAYPLLRLPLHEITDKVLDAESLLGSAAASLREELLESPTPARKFLRLERFLLHEAGAVWQMPPRIAFALRNLDGGASDRAVSKVARHSGASHKHLIQEFKERVGLTPRRFSRIRRFQKALREIERAREIVWSSLALDCGYYDQAHFIRDFQSFSGMNPSRYLVEKGAELNFVPLRER